MQLEKNMQKLLFQRMGNFNTPQEKKAQKP